jgi:hypothetical protein
MLPMEAERKLYANHLPKNHFDYFYDHFIISA